MPHFPLDKKQHPDFVQKGKKPVGPVEIDWSNPIARGLKHCLIFNGTTNTFDLADNAVYASEMSVGVASGVQGLLGDSTEKTLTLRHGTVTSSDVSIVSRIVLNGTPSGDEEVLVGKLDSGTSEREWLFRITTARELQWLEWDTSGANQTYTTTATIPTATQTTLGVSYPRDTSADTKLYIDGVNKSAGKSSTNKQTSPKAAPIRIGTCDTIDDCIDGVYVLTLIFDRVLTDTEHATLSRDPYQILKPSVDLMGFWSAGAPPAANDIPVFLQHFRNQGQV